jgi:hypothetical protein
MIQFLINNKYIFKSKVLIIFYFVTQFLKVITATGPNAEPDMNRFTISVVSKFIGGRISVEIELLIFFYSF